MNLEDSSLTQQRLKELLSYSPVTGIFTWKVSRGRVSAGSYAGGNPREGEYFGTRIDGKAYYDHRLAFLYMIGQWPRGVVDHIDGNTWNNEWRNLRDVPCAENQQNMKRASVASSTGLLGAYRAGKKYVAQIRAYGERTHLGTFASAKEAHAAYLSAKREIHGGNTL